MFKSVIGRIIAAIEIVVTSIVITFFWFIGKLNWVLQKILHIIEFAIIILLFLLGKDFVAGLPQPWQGYAIMSCLLLGSISFLCFIGLAFWKPEKFGKIAKKYL